jgi:hypothetical protein
MTEPTQLIVEVIPQEGGDQTETARLAGQLRKHLLSNDFDSSSARSGETPSGTKAGDHLTIGALIVSLTLSRPVLTSMVKVIQTWLETSKARSVK